jgi:hypothetical protein
MVVCVPVFSDPKSYTSETIPAMETPLIYGLGGDGSINPVFVDPTTRSLLVILTSSISGTNVSNWPSTYVLGSGTAAIGTVGVTSSVLPTGASTSALQTTGNTSLSTIAGAVSIPSTIVSGQYTVTTTATAITSVTINKQITLYAPATNTGTAVYIGPSGITASTGFPLPPGASYTYTVSNANSIYILGLIPQTKLLILGAKQ